VGAGSSVCWRLVGNRIRHGRERNSATQVRLRFKRQVPARVNSYRRVAESGPLVFESESFENFSNQWKARESYELVSTDEFIETFELAAPGKAFSTYSRNHLKRTGK